MASELELSEGSEILIDGTSISYDETTDEYEIEINAATLISLDLHAKLMRIKLHSKQIKAAKRSESSSTATTEAAVDEEASDETDQEQQYDEQVDEHEQVEHLDDAKEHKHDVEIVLDSEQPQTHKSGQQQHAMSENASNETVSVSEPTQQSVDEFVPKDQMEIIEMSAEEEEDDDDEAVRDHNVGIDDDDEERKKHDHRYDDLKQAEEEGEDDRVSNTDDAAPPLQQEESKATADSKMVQTKDETASVVTAAVSNEDVQQIKILEETAGKDVDDNKETESTPQETEAETEAATQPSSEHIIDEENVENKDNALTQQETKTATEAELEQVVVEQNGIVANKQETKHMDIKPNKPEETTQSQAGSQQTQSDVIIALQEDISNHQANHIQTVNTSAAKTAETDELETKPEPPITCTTPKKTPTTSMISSTPNLTPLIGVGLSDGNRLSDASQSHSRTHTQPEHDVDEYDSDEENDEFQDDEHNERSIKIEHNLRDPYLDELLTKQINAALHLESEDENNAEEYANSNEEEMMKNSIRNKNNWRWALKPENMQTEWQKYAPAINLQNISAMRKSLKNIGVANMIPFVKKQPCSLSIDACDCVQRLIFIMKVYSFWMKFKTETSDKEYKLEEDEQDEGFRIDDYPQSATELIESLKAYNRSKLLRDYLHIRHFHFWDDKLIAFIHRSNIPDCNDQHKMCKCITRNHQNKEIYKNVSKVDRRWLYWMQNSSKIEENSEEEVNEINLQKLLDVIHSSFLHNAISNGTKFVTYINMENIKLPERRRVPVAAAATSSLSSLSASSMMSNKPLIVHAPNYEFGVRFEFHDTGKSKTYCKPKYADLKTELLQNELHALSLRDFSCIYKKAQEYMECDEGCQTMASKRDILGVAKNTKITIEHIMVIFTRCNYCEIERKFNMNAWMKKSRKENQKSLSWLLEQNAEIANWNKLLIECILCFGGILQESQYIYHGINCKLTFKDINGIQFNLPISCTTQYSVARNFANEHPEGICLKLGKLELSKNVNYMLDVSDFSDYPNEREVLLFGDRLTFVDIVYDSLSHHDYVLSLKLYQQIIKGRFFTTNQNNDYHVKKHQRRIVKMIENMMLSAANKYSNNNNNSNSNSNNDEEHSNSQNEMVKVDLDLGLNYIDPYIQALFETITKNALKKTIWINKESDTLLPELKSVFINDFIPFLKKEYKITSKYAHVDSWCIQKKHINMTSRSNPLKSKPFDHIEILNNNENDEDDIDSTDNDNDNDNDVSNHNAEQLHMKGRRVNSEPMTLKQFKKLTAPTDLKISLGFRCYKKYDAKGKQDMFKGEVYLDSMPPQIESVRVLAGLWFEQIPLCKWDWCTFTNKKMSKGSSLFPIHQISEDEEFQIKICYQVKEVNEKALTTKQQATKAKANKNKHNNEDVAVSLP